MLHDQKDNVETRAFSKRIKVTVDGLSHALPSYILHFLGAAILKRLLKVHKWFSGDTRYRRHKFDSEIGVGSIEYK